MKTEMIRKNNTDIALIHSQQCLIQDAASALEFVMNVKYETGCTNIAVNKEAVAEEFFVLSNCLAGEILQKLVTYGSHFLVHLHSPEFYCFAEQPSVFLASSN